jgi:hypothetical protein
MRPVSYFKAIGIALGFITASHNTSLASTYTPSGPGVGDWGEGLRDGGHFAMRRDREDPWMQWRDDDRPSLTTDARSKSNAPNVSIETQVVTSLLDGTARHAGKNDFDPDVNVSSEVRFDPGESAAPVSATPLPAALPIFAGGLGVLGFLARRRKSKAMNSR